MIHSSAIAKQKLWIRLYMLIQSFITQN
jgi:hypothetical protein